MNAVYNTPYSISFRSWTFFSKKILTMYLVLSVLVAIFDSFRKMLKNLYHKKKMMADKTSILYSAR